MRPRGPVALVVAGGLALAAPDRARANSLAPCTTHDYAGLPASWSAPHHARLEGPVRAVVRFTYDPCVRDGRVETQ